MNWFKDKLEDLLLYLWYWFLGLDVFFAILFLLYLGITHPNIGRVEIILSCGAIIGRAIYDFVYF